MAEYIKRDELAKWLKDESDSFSTKDVAPVGWTLIGLINELSKIPTADVVERKHGKWETAYLDQQYAGCRPRAIYCSNCHIVSAFKTPFCPNCGAEMENYDEVI